MQTAHSDLAAVLSNDGYVYALGGNTNVVERLNTSGVNQPPVAVNDNVSGTEGQPRVIDVLANDSDPETDPLNIASVDVTGTLGAVVVNADDTITYTPAPGFTGVDSFTYKAGDGANESNIATVTITVNAINHAPVASDDAYLVDEDVVLNVVAVDGVLANDNDADGNPLTAVLVAGPVNGSVVVGADGSFAYTPATNFNGLDSFTYKANDGAADSNIATVTITVAPINDAPGAVDDAYSVDEDVTLNVAAATGVLANDSDVEGDPLTALLVTGPTNGWP
ncbi:MAG: tandem-95 repeat protein [bacterium]|nr:tandem-95 repeat protein [bacterium]